jgi:hypothetical protein
MREIKKDRWVYATEKEAMEYKKSLKRLKGKNENND